MGEILVLNGNMWTQNQTFYGMNSLLRATELPQGFAADSLNSDLGSSSIAAPMKGYARYGHQANPNNAIVRKFTYQKGDGLEIQLQVRDNATNYIVEYLNEEDTRNSNNGQWSILEAGLSRSRTLSDGTTKLLRIDFAPFNDTGTNQLVYCNGVESPRIWNGAIGKIASTTTTTITLNGSTTAATRGFGATGSLIINGTSYAYTGLSSNQFTGVTSDPTGEAVGSGITQVVNTSSLSAADKGSILLSAQQRLFMAGITAAPNRVTFSDIGDVTNYTGSTPSDGGFEDFPQMNGDITALSFLGEWILAFSERKIIAFKFIFPSSTTRVTQLKDIADEGAATHKAVCKFGDQIVYITPTGGIKRITQIGAENIFNVEDLTEPLRPTIKDFVWDDAALEYDKRHKVFFAAGKSSTDVDDNDKAVMLWLTEDGVGNKRFNLGIADWFIRDMTVFKQEVHFGSSVSSRSYRAFDGFTKDGGPYSWRRIERVELFDNAWEKKHVKFLGVRGEIVPGAKLNITLKYGTNGSISSQTMSISGTDTDFVVQQPLNVLGGFQLGTEPLGGTIDEIGEMNPYSVIFELPHIYTREFQLWFESEGTTQRVSVDSYGFNVEDTEQHITADEIKALG